MNKWFIIEVENGFIFQEDYAGRGQIEKAFVFNDAHALGEFVKSKLARPQPAPAM